MKKTIIISLLALQLFAQSTPVSQNPIIYSALGDEIYNNIKNVEKLQFITEYETDKNKIIEYVKAAQETKNIGFKIQNEDKNKSAYLKTLRKLSLTNEYFINKVDDSLIKSIKDEDNILFMKSVNSGLIDIPKNKEAILKYYYAHKDNIDASGVLKKIVDGYKKPEKPKGLTSKELEKLDIERIRKKYKAKKEASKQSLEEEVLRKKIEILKEQKKELGVITK